MMSIEDKLKGIKLVTKDNFGGLTPDEIKDQILLRRYLISDVLVGSLYPSILDDEIIELRKMQ